MVPKNSVVYRSYKLSRRLTVILVAVVAVACSSAPSPSQTPATAMTASSAELKSDAHRRHIKRQTASMSLEARLRRAVRQWYGTPHRMGGTTHRGVDCSGFVQRIYQDVLNQRIPRSTALQIRSGKAITAKRLRPGDLVFFKPPYKVRHVGIYLGKGEFAHASTSKGVTISQLRNPYWRRAYYTARRYLPSS